MKNGTYYAKVFGGSIIAYIALAHASGTNTILGTFFSGASNFTKAAQGR
ncbi:MAG: hypothetical protein JWM85_1130 [Acidimicrobiaceae bacterium]|nr:hypothetical protein [Acidimicrobiaceae bacterium]